MCCGSTTAEAAIHGMHSSASEQAYGQRHCRAPLSEDYCSSSGNYPVCCQGKAAMHGVLPCWINVYYLAALKHGAILALSCFHCCIQNIA